MLVVCWVHISFKINKTPLYCNMCSLLSLNFANNLFLQEMDLIFKVDPTSTHLHVRYQRNFLRRSKDPVVTFATQ